MLDETFASPMTPAEKLRLLRWTAVGATLVAVVSALLLLWWQSPVWKTWLFDLSIAGVFAAALYLAAHRLIAAEVEHRRREIAAVLIGVVGASAALGIFAVTLLGPPVGLEKLPALVVIQLLGALGGAALGFATGLLAAVVVRAVSGFFACSKPALDGAVIGALSGTIGSTLFVELPHLGWWFIVASSALCSLCASRAAGNFAALCTPRQSAD